MLKPGQQLPPLPAGWRGQSQQTTALQGQSALFFFPCPDSCAGCTAFFQKLRESAELPYWSIRLLWVSAPGAAESADREHTLIDQNGRCHALLAAGSEPTLAMLNADQVLKHVLLLDGHDFPSLEKCERAVADALLTSPGCGAVDWSAEP